MTKTRTIVIGLGLLAAALLAYSGTMAIAGKVAPTVAPAAGRDAGPEQSGRNIASHRAIYRIEMIAKRSSSQILNISGDMFFEWKPVCDAWSTTHRFDLNYEYTDAPPLRITSDFITYEKSAGESFDFNSRRRRDGEPYEELRGHAEIAGGKAVFTLPEGLEFDLPQGTLFPVAHTLGLLKAARAGKKFYTATVFDGSDDQGPVEIAAFIGKPVNALAAIKPAPAIDSSLINTQAWAVRLAFFPLASGEAESDYEMNAVLHDNGVISDMVVDYKDFSVTQKLTALEKIDPEPCGDRVPPVSRPPIKDR